MSARGETLSGRTRLAGVVGWPVWFSRSPRLHNFWLQRYGIEGAYVPLAVRPGMVEPALRGLMYSGFAGVNVTIPHKEEALALCDEFDEIATRCGAANTLTFTEDGRIFGSNTDAEGFLNNLRADGVDLTRGPAMVLGRRRLGACGLRGPADAGRAGDRHQPHRGTRRAAARAAARGDGAAVGAARGGARRPCAAGEHHLGRLVGRQRHRPARRGGGPAADLARARGPPASWSTTSSTIPCTRPLLLAAKARGLRIVDGLGMLLHQARPGFAAWFGVDPEVDAESRALVEADIPRE